MALAAVALQAGDYEEAYSAARVARGLEPTLSRAAAHEARALALSGRPDECLDLPLGAYALIHALCLEVAGRERGALALVRQAEAALAAGDTGSPDYLGDLMAAELAAYYGFRGDASTAARWLVDSFDRSPVGVDPRIVGSALFEPVRDDPIFTEALERAQRDAEARIRSRQAEMTGLS